jgi:tripartite-type tricarboxylate transporter receptor subunit TctC
VKPVRIVVAYPPGGGIDVMARQVAERLGSAWSQPVLVENKPGANTIVAADSVAKSAADGYTVLMTTDATFSINPHLYAKLPFDVQRDFVPVTQATTQPLGFAVHASVPARTVQEFVALARASPGKFAFAHSGTGSGQHLSGELFKKLAGIDMTHVPYKGGAPAVQDLVGGQVPAAFLGSTPLIPHHNAGRIRILAFTSKERFPALPEVPTLHESGFAGFDTSQWLGLLAPRGTSGEIVNRLHAETKKALELADVKERLLKSGLLTVGSSPKEFAAVIRADIERWSKLAGELGLQPQ